MLTCWSSEITQTTDSAISDRPIIGRIVEWYIGRRYIYDYDFHSANLHVDMIKCALHQVLRLSNYLLSLHGKKRSGCCNTDENRIEQCFAAHIVHSYQQYWTILLHPIQAQEYCSILLTSVNNVGSKTLFNPVEQQARRFLPCRLFYFYNNYIFRTFIHYLPVHACTRIRKSHLRNRSKNCKRKGRPYF
jgi:hypothetical protein